MTSSQTPVLDDWARSTWPVMIQLTQHRHASGLTRSDVAGKLGVTHGAVYKWECYGKSPKLETVVAYAALVSRRIGVWDGTQVVAEGLDIPAVLPSLRMAAGLTQADLAKLMHTTRTAVTMREAGGFVLLSSIEAYLSPLGARLILLPEGDGKEAAS